MATIDHRQHGSIVNAVFRHAPPASLAVMARTCREWRQRSLSRFHHIIDLQVMDTPKQQVTFWLPPKTYGALPLSFGRAEIGLLAGCKVLDITGDRALTNRRFLPNLDTVRYSRTSRGDMTPVPARQVVCQGDVYLMTERNPAVKRLVIDSGWTYKFRMDERPDLSGLTGLEQLVIIFEKVPLKSMEDWDEFHSDISSGSDVGGDIDMDSGREGDGVSISETTSNGVGEENEIRSGDYDSAVACDCTMDSDSDNSTDSDSNGAMDGDGNGAIDHEGNGAMDSDSDSVMDSDSAMDSGSDGTSVDGNSLSSGESGHFSFGSPRRLLGALRATMREAWKLNATVVLVGTEDWNKDAVHSLRLGIERTYEAEKPADDTIVTLMTIKAYRRFVGKKEWAVETDWSSRLTPLRVGDLGQRR